VRYHRPKQSYEFTKVDTLQQLCIDSGLVGRYVPYAFRRGALSIFKMSKELQAAQELAGHHIGGLATRHYDRQPLLGLDIAGLLTGRTTYDQEETYFQFALARTWKWIPTGNEPTLATAIH
jgi:hypothetical protein